MNTLYPYQKIGVEFLRSHERVILGDDRGLGKTAQALIATWRLPLLVVCSSFLKWKWEDEVRKWRPELEAVVVDGERKKREELLFGAEPVKIVNYEMLRSVNGSGKKFNPQYPELFKQTWGTVVFDEAHKLKNRNSQQTKGAFKLQAVNAYLLTANPITNSPEDLWSLLHIMHPHEYPSFWRWADLHCIVDVQYWATSPYPVRVVTGWRYPEMVRESLKNVHIRRLKTDPDIIDLPEKMPPVDVPVILPPDERKRYDTFEKECLLLTDDSGILFPAAEVAGRLRQLLTCPNAFELPTGEKQDVACKLIQSILEDTARVVVFCWYRATVAGLKILLDQAKVPVEVITGDVKMEDRWRIVNWFQSDDPSPRVVLGTIATMAEGIDLHRAKVAVFTELSYTPAENEQAMDRLHRIGQKSVVTIYRLVAQDTIDESLLRVLGRKQLVANEVWVTNEVLRSRLQTLKEVVHP